MLFLQIDFLSPLHDEAVQLRHQVLREPLDMSFRVEDLTDEHIEYHFAAYTDSWDLLGALTMRRIDPLTCKMRQVAVDPSVQSRGIGKYMVNKVEKWCLVNHCTVIELSAREAAVAFYSSMRYRKVGKTYIEIGLKHQKMEKQLI